MSETGYVYALINPSLEGMVKIGKTQKEPDIRAKELSSASGVPTSFVVAYKIYVNDCSSVEKLIHEYLEDKGYRISENREFFNAPLEQVIDAMLTAASSSSGSNDDFELNSSEYLDNENVDYSEELLAEGIEYLNGDGNKLQDSKKAFSYIKKAANFGNPLAYWWLSTMTITGDGCKQNIDDAIEYAMKGVDKGSIECCALLGKIYSETGLVFGYQHIQNAIKCWNMFFNDDSFYDLPIDSKAMFISDYIKNLFSTRYNANNISDDYLPVEHTDKIIPLKDEVMPHIENRAQETIHTKKFIEFAKKILNDEVESQSSLSKYEFSYENNEPKQDNKIKENKQKSSVRLVFECFLSLISIIIIIVFFFIVASH